MLEGMTLKPVIAGNKYLMGKEGKVILDASVNVLLRSIFSLSGGKGGGGKKKKGGSGGKKKKK
jgi:hypothetical protein